MRGVFLLVLLFSAATAAPAVFESASQIVRNVVSLFVEPDNEEAPYTVEQTFDEIEKRVYPARKWVCTGEQVEQDSNDNGRMFWKLFNYIQGANTDERKMAMTVPVATSVAKNGEEVRLEMCFYIGEEHQASVPEPTNPDVFIQNAERTIYTRTVPGYMNKSLWLTEAENLKTKLEELNLSIQQDRYFRVGYDAPFKWWNRRNEIWYVAA